MQVLRTVFPGGIFSRFADITWSARSPGLAVPEYFLLGYVESKTSESRPTNIYYLKNSKFWSVFNVPKEMLQCIMTSRPSQLQECIEQCGVHQQCATFKE